MTTAAICKNCSYTISGGNFCSNCGQTTHTHELNWHYVSHEIQHGIFHVDKGLIFTIIELAKNPGETIRQFIAGKRITYFKPAAMVIFLATIYGFLYHYFDIKIIVPFDGDDTKQAAIQKTTQGWIVSHYTLTVLMTIPLYTVATYFAFRKSRYNFVEHLALNSFLAGEKMAVQILLFPLLYFWQKSNNIGMVLTLSFVSDLALNIWIYGSFFNKFSIGSRIARILLSYVLFFAIFLILGIIVGVVLAFTGIINSA